MPFKKKNILLVEKSGSGPGATDDAQPLSYPADESSRLPPNNTLSSTVPLNSTRPGVRPSPLDGTPTISTGTASLDSIVAGGHSGLPLGTALLVEESGTADFGGLLLRYFAAEGLVQGHRVHALGYGDAWKADLPALAVECARAKHAPETTASQPSMRIAWRYEKTLQGMDGTWGSRFCQKFDLSKRLKSADIKGSFEGHSLRTPSGASLDSFVSRLMHELELAPSGTVHRVVIPNLLTPGIYAADDCHPRAVLGFLTRIRAILRRYPDRIAVMISFPIALFSRQNGLARWIELLADTVLELRPQSQKGITHSSEPARGSAGSDSIPQGFLVVHKLAIYQELGISSKAANAALDSFSFRISASAGMNIYPFSLPPADNDSNPDAKGGASGVDLAF